ncbi:MAG: sulfotransferase [Deltaproteobacteria bacterium]|nr:sulfotransferase [Deltaproteobacteria bacterium]
MIDPEGRNLIFLLSTPRAGSTLLGSVLGNHPQALCPSEPWLLLPLSTLHSNDAVIISRYDYDSAREAWWQWVNDELYNRATNAFAVTVYNALLAQAGKQIFIDKTPRYYHILPWLDAVFPRALKVWLKRNPLDVIASCKENWQLGIDELTGYVNSPLSFDSTVSFVLLSSYFEESSPTKYIIRYEDLVQNPAVCIEALCKFIALPFEEGIVNYVANTALMQILAEKPLGEKKILEHSRPHASSVGRWREVLTPEELRQILLTLGSDVFVRMGYGDLLREAAARVALDLSEIRDKGRLDYLLELYTTYIEQGLLLSGGIQYTHVARANSLLRVRLAESDADRAARLDVIHAQGQTLGTLEGERNVLRYELADVRQCLADVEADRAARLEVIEAQGQRLGDLAAERNRLQAESADFRQHFAQVEADRTARLEVIEEQGQRLGEVEGERNVLQAQFTELQAQFTAVEADRAARLAIIEEQGQRLGAVEAERNALQGQLAGVQQHLAATTMRLQSVEQVLQALRRGRLYRLLRRLGRWEWVEDILAQASTTPASAALSGDTGAPVLPAILPQETSSRLSALEEPSPLRNAGEKEQSEFEISCARIREPKKSRSVVYPPGSEDRITQRLQNLGFAVCDYEVDIADYQRYFHAARYREDFPDYYPANLPEKSLEHYLAAKLLQFDEHDVYIDIASEHSPVPEIYHRLFGVKAHRQDLAYPPGLNGDMIGGDAAHLPVSDGFATKLALHCSFEHFEGDVDIGFIREAARVLQPGGAVCIVPLYLFEEYAIQTDPTIAGSSELEFESDAVIYCAPRWNNRHGRFYDPEHLLTRIGSNLSSLTLKIYRITNAQQIDTSCYVRFVALVEKPKESDIPVRSSAGGSLQNTEPVKPEIVAGLVAPYVDKHELFSLWEAHGFHITPAHFHSPVPLVSALPETLWGQPSALIGVEMNEQVQVKFVEHICPDFKAEYDAFPHDPTPVPSQYYYNQLMFRSVDAKVLYCMIRHYRPRCIIEVGSGFSTYVAAAAVVKNSAAGYPSELLAIEPFPNEVLQQGFPGLSKLWSEPVQRIDLPVFTELQENDILFVDSSHVLHIDSDVRFLFLEVLPRLRPGVLVHFHDIFLPHEYPREWLVQEQRFWSEQYLLQAFLTFNRAFEVLWAGNYMHNYHREKLREAFPSCEPASVRPGSFWIRRVTA